MRGTAEFDLRSLPTGQTYEDRYQGYMKLLHDIAMVPKANAVVVDGPPWSWVPLLAHLRCITRVSPRIVFPHCCWVRDAFRTFAGFDPLADRDIDRTTVEVLCGFRPEMVDALWKCDMQWRPERVIKYPNEGEEFIVTNNGSFHRPEVQAYMKQLVAYKPTKKKLLLVPCAADKPYPAPMHQACLDRLPDDFYMACATGVVGIVPQDLWPIMPHYDSGIPNQWRLFEILRGYLSTHEHTHIVVYCDFYSQTICEAVSSVGLYGVTDFVLPAQEYLDYVDLMDARRLRELAGALRRGV